MSIRPFSGAKGLQLGESDSVELVWPCDIYPELPCDLIDISADLQTYKQDDLPSEPTQALS